MKSFITISLFLSSFISFSQIGFRTEIGTGAAFAVKDVKAAGFGLNVEPKILFGKRMAFGVRIESNFLYGGKTAAFGPEQKVGTIFRNGLLAKLDYSLPLGSGYTRLMLGGMGGLYTIRGIGDKASENISILSSRGIGFAPEIGLANGSYKISFMYHFVPEYRVLFSTDLTSSIAFSDDVSGNYFMINLTANLFSVGED